MSKRTEQIASLLRQKINEIILRDFEAPLGSLVSVTEVNIAPDLKNATAYLSIIPSNKIGSVLEKIKKFGPHVQIELGKKIIIRSLPLISWAVDERDIKYSQIDEALKQ